MAVEERLTRDQLVCYDVSQDGDFLALGTLLGQIIVWRLESVAGAPQSPQQLEGSLEQRIDKITIRHGKILVLQDGLLSVYSRSGAGEMFRLLYRRSVESPDPRLLGESGGTDQFWLPDLSQADLRLKYRARDPVKFPGHLVSVSTTGNQIFATARVGRDEVSFHQLETGEWRETMEVFFRVEHLAIVHLMEWSHLIYILVRNSTSQLEGKFYHLETRQLHSSLPLDSEFNTAAGFYSLFSEHGLLMMGRAHHSDSQSFQFCCWNYSGDLVYRYQDWAEFGLCLADCGPGSLTTPRSLNLLHVTSHLLTFSQRTHRQRGPLSLVEFQRGSALIGLVESFRALLRQ